MKTRTMENKIVGIKKATRVWWLSVGVEGFEPPTLPQVCGMPSTS